MIKHVFICSHEDYIHDVVTSAGASAFDVGDGSQWANALTVSGLFGVQSRTIDNVASDTITFTSPFGETVPIGTSVRSGETFCTYNYLYDTGGPDSLYSTSCRQKNCSGYTGPQDADGNTPIFKIVKTDTPYTVKSLGCDHYRFGFYGYSPNTGYDGVTAVSPTWLMDSNSPLVSPLVGFYVGDGVPLGLPAVEKFALVWKGLFYARHTGTVTFKFIGNGHYKFDFDGSNRMEADLVYDTYQSWTSSSLTAGTFYNFRAEFNTISREGVGFLAMWKSNAADAFPNYLPISAGVMIQTSCSNFLNSYELPNIESAQPDYQRGTISEFRFTIPLVKNNNTEGDGYFKDTDTGAYKHASYDDVTNTHKYQAADADYTLNKYNMIEYYEGFQSNAGTDDYVQRFAGHIVDFEPTRERDDSKIVVVCRDFGQLLKDSFTENNPNRLDYWMADYGDQSTSETTPEGLKAPVAWDGWELRKFFMVSMIDAGIDPVLFDRKQQRFDKDYTADDSVDWEVSSPDLTVYLDKRINYGNPDAVGDREGKSEDITIDEEYLYSDDYGTPWVDVVDNVVSQYLYDWGFKAEGYPWLRGRLIPTTIADIDAMTVSGTGW